MDQNKILYFSYGANMDEGMIGAITGNDHLIGYPAILEGYKLGVQRIDQAPQDTQALLRQGWGEDFKTYVIFPQDGSRVSGKVWELSETERRLVRNWELVGEEVGPRLAWYKQINIPEIKTLDGRVLKGIETEILGDGQGIDESIFIDGENYSPYLMNPAHMWTSATKDRIDFFEREKAREGSIKKEV